MILPDLLRAGFFCSDRVQPIPTSQQDSRADLKDGGDAADNFEEDEELQKTPRSDFQVANDSREMVLLISGCTALQRRGESYPLKLQRSEFMTCLPANPHLLEIIETGIESGSLFRRDEAWQESPLGTCEAALKFGDSSHAMPVP